MPSSVQPRKPLGGPMSGSKRRGFTTGGTFRDGSRFRAKIRPDWRGLFWPAPDMPDGIEFGHWFRDVGKYHYAARTSADGSFEIRNVQPGNYSLFVWQEGVYGEWRKDHLSILPEATLDVGICRLEPRSRGRLLWQLGTPDRSVREYRNGRNFHQWDTYLRYREAFPFDLNFDIGRSVPGRDWNYLQPAIVEGESVPTRASVRFELEEPPDGQAILTVVCGGRGARLHVAINGTTVGHLTTGNIGLQHIRTAPYGELLVREFTFDAGLLRERRNELTLTFGSGDAGTDAHNHPSDWTRYIAYDFLRLEVEE